MVRNFIRISDKSIHTPAAIELMGLDSTNDALMRQAGFLPVYYPYPAYDNLLEIMEPDGDPVPNEDNSAYEQKFKVTPLAEDIIVNNLAGLAAYKASEARAAADAAVAPYMAEFSDVEKQTWAKQQAEVAAYLADTKAPTPTLDGLAQARGIDRAVMLEKAIAKVTAFEPLSVAVVGKQQAYEDQIKAVVGDTSKTLAERIAALRNMSFEYVLD